MIVGLGTNSVSFVDHMFSAFFSIVVSHRQPAGGQLNGR